MEGLAYVVPLVRHLRATLTLWTAEGLLDQALARLAAEPDRRGTIDWEEGSADGKVAAAKKRGDCVGLSPRGKGTKGMVLTNGQGVPLAIEIEASNVAEVKLIEPLLDAAFTPHVSPRLLYDKACDSDPLRERLAQRGVDLIYPHRKGRVSKPSQDRRKLRRHKRRWKGERAIAWLHAFRRVVTRYELYAVLYRAFPKVACLMMPLRRL